jgi:hypothetical protein
VPEVTERGNLFCFCFFFFFSGVFSATVVLRESQFGRLQYLKKKELIIMPFGGVVFVTVFIQRFSS